MIAPDFVSKQSKVAFLDRFGMFGFRLVSIGY